MDEIPRKSVRDNGMIPTFPPYKPTAKAAGIYIIYINMTYPYATLYFVVIGQLTVIDGLKGCENLKWALLFQCTKTMPPS